MIRALFTSATGMNVQSTTIDNTANNLANVNTNGFKKGQVDFQDLIYVTEKTPGAEAAQGLNQLSTGMTDSLVVVRNGLSVELNNHIHSAGCARQVGRDLRMPPVLGKRQSRDHQCRQNR